MGRWAEAEYDRVVFAKFKALYEACNEIGDPTSCPEGSSSSSNLRFRSFIRNLDPTDKRVQACFRTLVHESRRSAARRDTELSRTQTLAQLFAAENTGSAATANALRRRRDRMRPATRSGIYSEDASERHRTELINHANRIAMDSIRPSSVDSFASSRVASPSRQRRMQGGAGGPNQGRLTSGNGGHAGVNPAATQTPASRIFSFPPSSIDPTLPPFGLGDYSLNAREPRPQTSQSTLNANAESFDPGSRWGNSTYRAFTISDNMTPVNAAPLQATDAQGSTNGRGSRATSPVGQASQAWLAEMGASFGGTGDGHAEDQNIQLGDRDPDYWSRQLQRRRDAVRRDEEASSIHMPYEAPLETWDEDMVYFNEAPEDVEDDEHGDGDDGDDGEGDEDEDEDENEDGDDESLPDDIVQILNATGGQMDEAERERYLEDLDQRRTGEFSYRRNYTDPTDSEPDISDARRHRPPISSSSSPNLFPIGRTRPYVDEEQEGSGRERDHAEESRRVRRRLLGSRRYGYTDERADRDTRRDGIVFDLASSPIDAQDPLPTLDGIIRDDQELGTADHSTLSSSREFGGLAPETSALDRELVALRARLAETERVLDLGTDSPAG